MLTVQITLDNSDNNNEVEVTEVAYMGLPRPHLVGYKELDEASLDAAVARAVARIKAAAKAQPSA